jgi:hypothetical protein
MTRHRRWHILVIALLASAGLIASPAIASAGHADDDRGDSSIRLTPIGKPSWKPVDLHLFSAPIGTAETGYAEFSVEQGLLLPPPNHVPVDGLGIGPGVAHKPPYNKEFRNGIRSLGLHEGSRFGADEFSAGSGVWLVWMTVPRPGERGSSPDFDRGPIIPNRLFPIAVSGSTFRGGQPFSTPFEFHVPPLDGSAVPQFDVDGHSHFPVFFADNRDFGPQGVDTDPVGRYIWHMKMVDTSKQGWKIDATFVVKN